MTDEQREALERIQRSQRHLLGLINDILNFARLESGRVDYRPRGRRRGDAVAEVAGARSSRRSPRSGSRYDVRRRDAAAAVAVLADRDKLRQMLLNLLSNAVKFTRAPADA